MFQTVGHQSVTYIAQAVGLPIYRYPTFGKANVQEKDYYPTESDEVEDLFNLLSEVKVNWLYRVFINNCNSIMQSEKR
jgi:diphthine-ammonia ligase